MNVADNMNMIYRRIVCDVLQDPDRRSTTRRGEAVYEKFNYSFTLTDPFRSFVDIRKASWDYLQKEFAFYMSGSDSVENAAAMSKFWLRCSDDRKTINSNYGKLLFHDKNSHGNTQFQHAIQCLLNNPFSKKSVMTLYNPEHAYMSNDNPCTMFLSLFITPLNEDFHALHMTAFMRSNDIWFGTVYDVPFFCAVLYSAWRVLLEPLQRNHRVDLKLGTYTHHAVNIHAYERNKDQLEGALSYLPEKFVTKEEMKAQYDVVSSIARKLVTAPAVREQVRKEEIDPQRRAWREGIKLAWKCAELSPCLKKQCGAVILSEHGAILGRGFSGREHGVCKECARDKSEVFYSDGCYSVHAEMRAIFDAMEHSPSINWSKATLFSTHGPCDACMKLMDFIGIRTCVYDVPYKTDYAHYPRVQVHEERVHTEIAGKYA